MSERRIPLEKLPRFPLFLDKTETARYLGVSIGTLDLEIRLGVWPPGQSRGERGGKLCWHKPTLRRLSELGTKPRTAAEWKLIAEASRRAIG